jgi:molybdate transport system permease protein
LVFAFRWTGAALAAGVMAFPLIVRPIRLAIESIDREVDEAARTLGAGRLARLTRVTIPLAAPGLIAGCVLGFAKALGEFGATITFVAAIPGETLTLPSAIYQATQTPGAETRAIALCAVAAAIAIVAVFASDAIGRRAALRRGRG